MELNNYSNANWVNFSKIIPSTPSCDCGEAFFFLFWQQWLKEKVTSTVTWAKYSLSFPFPWKVLDRKRWTWYDENRRAFRASCGQPALTKSDQLDQSDGKQWNTISTLRHIPRKSVSETQQCLRSFSCDITSYVSWLHCDLWDEESGTFWLFVFKLKILRRHVKEPYYWHIQQLRQWPPTKSNNYDTESKRTLFRSCIGLLVYLFGASWTREWEGLSFDTVELSKSTVSNVYVSYVNFYNHPYTRT